MTFIGYLNSFKFFKMIIFRDDVYLSLIFVKWNLILVSKIILYNFGYMYLDFSLILFLCLFISYLFIFFWILFAIHAMKKNINDDFLTFFSKNMLLHDFFSKYKYLTIFFGIGCCLTVVPVVGYVLWLSISLSNPNYYLNKNIFIGFNIGFILFVLWSIVFLLVFNFKLFFLKKEFMSYKLKFLVNINDTELFNLEINNCDYAATKNKYFQKKLNKIKEIASNKKILQGNDLIKFLVKNYHVFSFFYNFFRSCKNEQDLDIELNGFSFGLSDYHLHFRFCDKKSKKYLYNKEIYEIFINYLDSFEFMKLN